MSTNNTGKDRIVSIRIRQPTCREILIGCKGHGRDVAGTLAGKRQYEKLNLAERQSTTRSVL